MKALEHLRVLDLTQFRSGPVCTEILLDLGADVIKFENPATGGEANRHAAGKDGISFEFMSTSRGKKSVLLDLKNPEIRALFLKLVKDADVLVENYRPGTMEKLGVGYETLHEINPSLIVTSISGYGQTGPWAQRGAYDSAIQAVSGFMSITGTPDGPPLRAGLSLADMQAGLWGAIGTLAALERRRVSGLGTHVDISMLECMLYLADAQATQYMLTGEIPHRRGNRHHAFAPFQPFPCKNGEYVLICCPKQEQFQSLCEGLGRPELALDLRFADGNLRHENEDALEKEISALTCTWDAAALKTMLEERKLVGSEIDTLPQALELEQSHARGVLTDVHWPGKPDIFHTVATPVRMSGLDRSLEFSVAALGRDTFEVFSPYADGTELHRMFDPYFTELSAQKDT